MATCTAILGGTFDPVHRGHLTAARIGGEALFPPSEGKSSMPPVMLMLAARPWHRPPPMASVEHRWRMLRLAAQGHPWVSPSNLEVRRRGPSYTVDTLAELAGEGPLVWFIGGDAVAAIASWRNADALPSLCHLLVFDRPGAPRRPAPVGFEPVACASDLCSCASGGVHYLQEPMPDISSTRVRRMIAAGKEPHSLLANQVWTYIKEHGLYGFGVDETGVLSG